MGNNSSEINVVEQREKPIWIIEGGLLFRGSNVQHNYDVGDDTLHFCSFPSEAL